MVCELRSSSKPDEDATTTATMRKLTLLALLSSAASSSWPPAHPRYDVVVLGSGLKESLLAGLLAESGEPDGFGRQFSADTLLRAPYCAVRVTGALFHTQGGLLVDDHARVKRADGSVFDSLFACGGAACGVSGPDVSGYLSGNGLLTALALGHLAGGCVGRKGG